MSTIERPNRDTLNKALDIYRDAMRPFVVRSLKRVRGKTLDEAIYDVLPNKQAYEFQNQLERNGGDVEAAIDIGYFPTLISKNWKQEVFGRRFTEDMTVQDMLRIITKARNHVAHPGTADLDNEYTRTCLFHIVEVLNKINSPDEKAAVEELRDALFNDKNKSPMPVDRKTQPTAIIPNGELDKKSRLTKTSLKPWREVIPPNFELTQGTFEEAELAADLQQVYDGRASATSYGNPVSFFNQTYLTGGIRALLVNALKKLSGKGGDPVIQTKTGFGGGKTHSLIALYHLVNSIDAFTNRPADGESTQTHTEIHGILHEAGWDTESGAQPKVAVLVGTYLSPTDTELTKENGDPLNTLWGVMAYQLGGQEAYNLIREAAIQQSSAPLGAQLDRLFASVGPCVILMDELVAYMQNVAEKVRGVNYTFIQALTESVRRAKNVILVVTLPESQGEAGGVEGEEILSILEARVGRIESIWKPLEINEAFEVVRRRLFGNKIDEAARDHTCGAFINLYNNNRKQFPKGVHEQRYLERMKACYPIHPEIFDRLHSDWSTIHGFQRTRGVLRLMAITINRLYQRSDAAPLIMPATLPLNDENLSSEFEKWLPGRWEPVLAEFDKDGSRVDLIDSGQRRFGVLGGAARRIARTVFLGSCPSGAIKGIDAHQIHLGVAQPGHGIATYTEALNEMSGNLYYLYNDNNRYYFHAEENLNKVAIDRANEFSNSELTEQIILEIQDAVGKRTDVVICPKELLQDPDELRLIILPPNKSLPSRASETDEATPTALQILTHRADVERTHRNVLLFLTAKTDGIRALKNIVRNSLSWKSIIHGERRIQNLTGERLKQAQAGVRKADEEIRRTIPKTYRWAIAPAQLDPQCNEFSLSHEQTRILKNGDIVESAFKTFKAREALIEYETPEALDARLKEYVWDNQNHISISDLWNMMTCYVYMPRLLNRSVLITCIKEGVQNGTFGYAKDYDSEQRAYRGMCFAQAVPSVEMNGLLVKSEIAKHKPPLSLDSLAPETVIPEGLLVDPKVAALEKDKSRVGSTRIIARKTVQGELSLDDMNDLRQEIIEPLNTDGGEVTVEITITAYKADGFSQNIERSVKENSAELDVEVKTNSE